MHLIHCMMLCLELGSTKLNFVVVWPDGRSSLSLMHLTAVQYVNDEHCSSHMQLGFHACHDAQELPLDTVSHKTVV